jgi:hypothetical protein
VIVEDLPLLASQSLADRDWIEVDDRPVRPEQRLGLQHWRYDDPVRVQRRETLRQEGGPSGRAWGESRVGEALLLQGRGEQGHAPAAVLRVHGPRGDVADERCLPVHLPPGGDQANETDDCVAVEEHEAAPVIRPAMVEQPAPRRCLDSREGLLEEAADWLDVVLTRGTEMRPD